MERQHEFKVVTLGEGEVGKTSLTLRFCNDTFQDRLDRTYNATFLTKEFHVDGKSVKLNIWDTAGQERYRALTPNYYRQASGALIVYDITKKHSFDRVVEWVRELEAQADANIVIIIAGNKCDREHERQVDKNECLRFAQSIQVDHFSTSAKNGRGVSEVFSQLARQVIAKQAQQAAAPNRRTRGEQKIVVQREDHQNKQQEVKKKKKKCC